MIVEQSSLANLEIVDTLAIGGNINGPLMVCNGNSNTYTINADTATNYNWIINGGQILSGQGTNSISASFSTNGTLQVIIRCL